MVMFGALGTYNILDLRISMPFDEGHTVPSTLPFEHEVTTSHDVWSQNRRTFGLEDESKVSNKIFVLTDRTLLALQTPCPHTL
jgi:hypothetical protein